MPHLCRVKKSQVSIVQRVGIVNNMRVTLYTYDFGKRVHVLLNIIIKKGGEKLLGVPVKFMALFMAIISYIYIILNSFKTYKYVQLFW